MASNALHPLPDGLHLILLPRIEVNSTATLMDPGVAALPVAGGGFVRRPRAVSSIY